MKTPCLVALMILIVCVMVTAQQPETPVPSTSSQPVAEADDISGMYSFMKEGEFVQITVEESGVTGFVSRFGDTEDDRGTFLDQFFSKAALKDKHLTFTTKKVHGVWFDFAGSVERGPGKTPHEDAYRVIRGTLTQSTNNADNRVVSKSREIVMKSFPQDLDDDVSPKKP